MKSKNRILILFFDAEKKRITKASGTEARAKLQTRLHKQREHKIQVIQLPQGQVYKIHRAMSLQRLHH